MTKKSPGARSDNTEEKQSGLVPYRPGQSGNPTGRPKGSRNKLGEDFIAAMYDDFSQHGAAVIAKVREERPAEYLRVVASLLPKVLQLEGDDRPASELSDAELMAVIRGTASACGLVVTEAEDDPPQSKH